MTDRVNRLGVAIAGAGHSGSTLLGLVLGSHDDAFYAGEAKKTTFFGDENKPLRKRVCKICGPECEVWSRFVSPPTPDLFEHIARITSRTVVVDSTKKPDWIRARRAELDAAGVPHRLLFLTRDGRAVVNSRLRKHPDHDPVALVDRWLAQIDETEALARERPDDTMRVRYEELATRPEATLRRVCAFLGLAFDEAMLRYESHRHHPLGGNTGTQSVVARAAAIESGLARVPERSRAYYEDLRGGFQIDLRWRDELPADVRHLFERRAGAQNKPFRWDGDEA